MMTTHTLRLHPKQDLKRELQQFVIERDIKAACIVTCVGSLEQAALRFAGRDAATVLEKKMEILALSGTLGTEGVHLHIALADGDGQTVGGHVMESCVVYTTAEIVIGEIPGVVFGREIDGATGYRELAIRLL